MQTWQHPVQYKKINDYFFCFFFPKPFSRPPLTYHWPELCSVPTHKPITDNQQGIIMTGMDKSGFTLESGWEEGDSQVKLDSAIIEELFCSQCSKDNVHKYLLLNPWSTPASYIAQVSLLALPWNPETSLEYL